MTPASAALELLGRLETSVPKEEAKAHAYLAELRRTLETDAHAHAEAEEALKAFEEAYEKLTAPANKIGVFLKTVDDAFALVVLGDTEYVANVDPKIDRRELQTGVRVRLNDAYAVTGVLPAGETGHVTKVAEALDDGRIRVGTDPQNQQGRLLFRSEGLKEAKIKPGDEVRTDSSGRVAVEHFAHQETREYFMEEVPPIAWDQVGGQDEAIALIRETIEHPLLYPDLYRKFDKKPIKGILLYGPPGCGKTLLGKAVAHNLAKEYSERSGQEVKECFLHISGPKVLNMWLGETERMVREIFASAREQAKDGRLVVLFIDEAESILRTRSSGRWLNISNTVVPQFCAEMDGMVGADNVVLILTSNRPDYIDPAILRPERIDRKVKVNRPDKEASRDILGIYLHDRLPLEPALVKEHVEPECARLALIESTLAFLWRSDRDTEFMRVQMRNGTTKTLHWRDMVSGALLKSIVDRAKDAAIRRAVSAEGADDQTGLREEDLHEAVAAEYRENEIFPKSDAVEDWLKLLDFEPETVVNVKTVRTESGDTFVRKTVV
ncbi:MAG: AAA family ATPase [Armatimonadetes bacterium]|nr:AAA family ATPase [Armatimonadota bacterium]